jgi:Outer membrane protein LpxR
VVIVPHRRAGGTVVVRDLFLDGNTFSNSPFVKRRLGQHHWILGVSVRIRGIMLEYRVRSQSKEYTTEISRHEISTLAVRLGHLR